MRTIDSSELAGVTGGAGAVLGSAAAGAWTGASIGKYVGSPATGAVAGGVIGAAAAGIARKDPWCIIPGVAGAIGGFAGGGPAGATAAATAACAGGALLHDELLLANGK